MNKQKRINKNATLLSNGKAPNWYGQQISRRLMNERQ